MSEDPKDKDVYYWEEFVIYCEERGISMDPEDYEMWWDCWKAGYTACLKEEGVIE